MLSPRAIAMQGVGSAVLVFALQGLVGEESGASRREVIRLSSPLVRTLLLESTI